MWKGPEQPLVFSWLIHYFAIKISNENIDYGIQRLCRVEADVLF